MPQYIDAFVVPVPKKNLDEYRRIARLAGEVWREHGALEYRECLGEDLDVPAGTPFPRGIQLKRGETVLFSWVLFKSRAHRDRVNAKFVEDPRMKKLTSKDMPFDDSRMLWGGFEVFVAK